MSGAGLRTTNTAQAYRRHGWRMPAALRSAGPALLFGIRLWAAVCLALFVAFWLQLDTPSWAGTSAAIVCQPVLGASLRKGWFRLVGTIIGAIAAVLLSACFPQSRAGFLIALALWGGVCALVATLLRNFASYAAALAGYTTAIIAGDELGSVGGASGDAFNLAVARGTEIGIGIVCAGVVLATTDLGGTRRRLATLLAALSASIASGLMHALQLKAAGFAESRAARRQLVVQVSGLDTVIDQAAGEVTTLPFHPRALQSAVDGLFVALTAWRSVAIHLEFVPEDAAEAARVQDCLLPALAPAPAPAEAISDPARWEKAPLQMRAEMWAAALRLVALPAEAPSLRLLCDRTAEGLLALRRAVTGVVVLGQPQLAQMPRRVARLRVHDVLPALINGIRAFLTIGAASLIWIGTGWPGGTTFIVFTAIGITLFAPQGDAAYATARTFTIGTALTAVCAAIVGFALLPQQPSFVGLCAALGLVLVPAGALATQPWQTGVFVALEANFIPLLGPSNPMIYDLVKFYNSAMAILSGIGFAMLAIRVLPPVSPELRARRLLGLTMRDLRRLTRGKLPRSSAAWTERVYGRLSAIPNSVDRLQAARLASTLSVGAEIIRLRHIAARFALDAELEPAMAAIAKGDSAAAIRALARFDRALSDVPTMHPGARPRLRARGIILSITDSLTQHATYYDARVPR